MDPTRIPDEPVFKKEPSLPRRAMNPPTAYTDPVPYVYGLARCPTTPVYWDFITGTDQTNFRQLFPAYVTSGSTYSGGVQYVAGESQLVTTCLAVCQAPVHSIQRYWRDNTSVAITATDYKYLVGIPTPPEYLGDANNKFTVVTESFPPTWDRFSKGIGNNAGVTLAGTVQIRADKLAKPDGTFPRVDAEVAGFCSSGSDADPADVIIDLVHRVPSLSGVSVIVDTGPDGISTSGYRTYCASEGFRVSRCVNAQTNASALIDDLLTCTNSTMVWSEGVLKVYPLADTATGSYTPPAQAVAINFDDLGEDENPIQVERSPDNEVFNCIPVTYKNRYIGYEDDTQEYVELSHATIFGLKKSDPVPINWICTSGTASKISQILTRRSINVRNTYTFKPGPRYNLLEPGDLIALTDSGLGLTDYQVRITSIEEDENADLTFRAVDWPAGTAKVVDLTPSLPDGYQSGSVQNYPWNKVIEVSSSVDKLWITINNIGDDNVLSRDEKSFASGAWTSLSKSGADTCIRAYNQSLSTASFSIPWGALNSYLATISPPWNDLTQASPITGSVWRVKWSDAYEGLTKLQNEISADASSKAGSALQLAGSKARVFYQAAAPGADMSPGDIWFSTDISTECPDQNCKGHPQDGNGDPLVGSYAHRGLYWGHIWNGSAWIDNNTSALIIASEIAAGAIVADKIAANAITTSKLLINGGVGAALNSDPSCIDATAWTWSGDTPSFTTTSLPYVGNRCIAGTNGVHVFSNMFAIDSNKTYRWKCWWRGTGGSTATAYCRAYWFDSSGASCSTPFSDSTTTRVPSWAENVGSGKPPSDARFAKVAVVLNYNDGTGAMEAQDIRFEEVIPGDLIVSGSINVQHLERARIVFDNGTWAKVVGVNFGTDHLTEWYGHSSDLGSPPGDGCTIANAHAYQDAAGAMWWGGYAGSTSVTVDYTYVQGFGTGVGTQTVTSDPVTATPTGGKPNFTYSWSRKSGNTINVDSPTSATTTFSRSLPAGVAYTAIFTCTVTDSLGKTAAVDVECVLDNT